MPSVISHAAVAAAAGVAFAPADVPYRFWPLAVACSVAPDLDTVGFYFGVPYNHFFGHRGFFHSPLFGLLMSLLVVCIFFHDARTFSTRWFFYFIFFFLVSTSHGILDAFTSGGLGIALLSPFDSTRYFSPWTPITVSPIDLKSFFSKWGWAVIKSEILWLWIPAFSIAIAVRVIRTKLGI